MRRWLVGLLVLGLVGVTAGVGVTMALLAGSGAGDAPAPRVTPGPGGPAATGAPSADLSRFYGQQPDWQPCGRFYCARLTVPLDYADPAGETISLALLMRPAGVPGERVGYLVVNPGGPGAPGTDYARGATTYFRRELTDRFDVVGFDPRGTGDSSPVDCLTDAEMDAWISVDRNPDTPAEEQELLDQMERFGAGCTARSGALAAHISTIEAARDIDVLRSALGEETLTYFGASYGTKLGATYADLFPGRAGRLVLDGAVDPTLGVRAVNREQAAGFDTALRAYVQNCVDSTDSCFLGSSVDAGVARVAQLLADLDNRPLPAGAGRELTSGAAFFGIAVPLYNRDYWFLLSQGLKDALDGDGRALQLLADAYFSRNADGSYASNSEEAYRAITCLDNPAWLTPAQVERQLPSFERAAPTFGDVFAWDTMMCRGFTARAEEQPQPLDAPGAPPILVIGTTRDPATPLTWAQALAGQLDSGVLVTRDGDGHTGYHSGNGCVDDAVEAYLIDGTVPQDGLAC